MNMIGKDPLLLAAKAIVGLMIGLCIFVMVIIGIGIGAILTVQRAELLAKLAEVGAPDAAYWALIAVLAGIIGVFWLGYRFFRCLWELIGSVDAGEPFRPENGDILARMGWIAVGAQISMLLIAIPGAWLASFAEKAGNHADISLDLGLGGILLVLILFILARVFRHGAAMREDLEGTV